MKVLDIPLAFVWTAILIELTPGPNMSYLAVLSLAEGRRAGFAAVAGVATGLLIVGLFAALGLAAVISESPLLYNLLRWSGVIYLVWLAYDIWIGGDNEDLGSSTKEGSWYQFFRRGLVTNLLNPKAAVIYITVLPPFVNRAQNILWQTIALSVAYVIVATIIHCSIVILAGRARPHLENAVTMTALRQVLATSVLMIAIWLAWTTRAGIAV